MSMDFSSSMNSMKPDHRGPRLMWIPKETRENGVKYTTNSVPNILYAIFLHNSDECATLTPVSDESEFIIQQYFHKVKMEYPNLDKKCKDTLNSIIKAEVDQKFTGNMEDVYFAEPYMVKIKTKLPVVLCANYILSDQLGDQELNQEIDLFSWQYQDWISMKEFSSDEKFKNLVSTLMGLSYIKYGNASDSSFNEENFYVKIPDSLAYSDFLYRQLSDADNLSETKRSYLYGFDNIMSLRKKVISVCEYADTENGDNYIYADISKNRLFVQDISHEIKQE